VKFIGTHAQYDGVDAVTVEMDIKLIRAEADYKAALKDISTLMESDPLFGQDDAAAPLAPQEREGLIPSYITLRRVLNEAEQVNILEAGV